VSPEQIQGWLQLGLGGLMLVALFLGHRRIWVFGWLLIEAETRLDEMQADRDFWRNTALKAMGHTDKAMDVAKKATGV
jgi:hypothetical protein